jgi:hypothetical protein
VCGEGSHFGEEMNRSPSVGTENSTQVHAKVWLGKAQQN